jgi:2-polyprenyl-3-methyl-5-hydroxy-6-metoxy-1,4-benzoquinol methylase
MAHFGRDFSGIEIYRCDRCLLVKADIPDRATGEAAKMYDDAEYFEGWNFNAELDYESFDKSLFEQAEVYVDFIKKHTAGNELLDVGTGHGLLPYTAQKHGYQVEGTDLSKWVCDLLPEKVGFAVHHGPIENIEFAHHYDVITLMHVLEHTTDPVSTIARCAELLKETGYIIVVVPNYRSLDCRLKDLASSRGWKKRPFKHLALGHHNWVFSLDNLQRLGEKCGLKTVFRRSGHASWKAGLWNGALSAMGLAGWCYIVYEKQSTAERSKLPSLAKEG